MSGISAKPASQVIKESFDCLPTEETTQLNSVLWKRVFIAVNAVIYHGHTIMKRENVRPLASEAAMSSNLRSVPFAAAGRRPFT
jgi:hypothetical protein